MRLEGRVQILNSISSTEGGGWRGESIVNIADPPEASPPELGGNIHQKVPRGPINTEHMTLKSQLQTGNSPSRVPSSPGG